MKAKKIKLSKLQEKVAKNIQKHIEETKRWLDQQEEEVNEVILSGQSGGRGYDLRQTVQAYHTAKNTLSHLINTFEEYVGCTYEAYCEAYDVKKIETVEEKLVSVVKDLIAKVTG
ncbi:MAG: hypothetical protein ACXADH_03095 [Candidatus Kariarchaeaceae archaeon]|jgi:hypothetical protein